MIIVLFGQPGSGKTTLASQILANTSTYVNIDGDALRELFANKDYSREGRIKNLNRASDIAHFLNSTGKNVILSLVYPYKEARDYLRTLTSDVSWIYLTYEEDREKEDYQVKDFEKPIEGEDVLHIDTSSLPIQYCLHLVNNFVYKKTSAYYQYR
jgi:adenylylsulfate kinase-like enzyme